MHRQGNTFEGARNRDNIVIGDLGRALPEKGSMGGINMPDS
jgi:hypothetical protein